MMTSLYYYDQKPSGFYFLLQIRAFNIYIFFYKGKYKGKIKQISKLMASFLMFVRNKEGTGNLHF